MDKIQKVIKDIIQKDSRFEFVEKIGTEPIPTHIRFIPKELSYVPTPKNTRKFNKICWIEISANTKSSPDPFNNPYIESIDIIIVVKSRIKDPKSNYLYNIATKTNSTNTYYFNNMSSAIDATNKNRRYVHFHTEKLLSKNLNYFQLLNKSDSEIEKEISTSITSKIDLFIEKIRLLTEPFKDNKTSI